MNMSKWLHSLGDSGEKRAMPILSFPSATLLGVSVRQLVTSSTYQAKGMRLIADRCDSLASVSMMDLSLEAEAFGAEVKYTDDEVPTIVGASVTTPEDAESLVVPPVTAGRCPIYIDAIKQAKELITDRPIFAGVIGPFSLAGRLMDVSEAMMNCYDEPEMVHVTLEKVTQFLINYILEYKRVGANGVVIAEPLAGVLSPTLEEEFSAPYVRRIIDAVQDEDFIVIYHNCGPNTTMMTSSISQNGAMAYHFGDAVEMVEILEKMPKDKVVMGNISPVEYFLNGTSEDMYNATISLIDRCEGYPNFVLSSGCDIPPRASWDNIDAFFRARRDR